MRGGGIGDELLVAIEAESAANADLVTDWALNILAGAGIGTSSSVSRII